jgi:thiamine biosynthesis lipoprotein ApbE
MVVGRLALRDRGASVSAVFGGDRRRAHVVDPRTGNPLRDHAVSVIVAPTASDAEAWSKAVLVAGPAGIRIAERRGVEAARLDRHGVAIGSSMRAARSLRMFDRPRALAGEVALR